jgi:site-specific DNA-methyltransferase (adenine-specific)
VYYGRYKVIPIHSEIIRFCEAIGLDFMGQIIWQKTTTMNTSGGGAVMGSFPYPRNGIVKLDFEYILLFKKQGDAPKPTAEQKANAAMTNEEWNTFFNGHWYFNGAKQDKHLAMFPEELPHRLIKMFSFEGETVLDPFMGSGTTAWAARKLNRNAVGYEINPEFIPIIKDKIGTNDAFTQVETEIIQQPEIEIDFEEKINKLPYRFVDTHKLDKKIDVKRLQYGSKIDAESNGKREEYFSVKEIISPELLRLNNDLIIRLIGIKQKPAVNGKATEFLREKLKGKRVFLRHDEVKHDSDKHLMAYLYLENKTFINAHLLKAGLAEVDNELNFKYKGKFRLL